MNFLSPVLWNNGFCTGLVAAASVTSLYPQQNIMLDQYITTAWSLGLCKSIHSNSTSCSLVSPIHTINFPTGLFLSYQLEPNRVRPEEPVQQEGRFVSLRTCSSPGLTRLRTKRSLVKTIRHFCISDAIIGSRPKHAMTGTRLQINSYSTYDTHIDTKTWDRTAGKQWIADRPFISSRGCWCHNSYGKDAVCLLSCLLWRGAWNSANIKKPPLKISDPSLTATPPLWTTQAWAWRMLNQKKSKLRPFWRVRGGWLLPCTLKMRHAKPKRKPLKAQQSRSLVNALRLP